MEKAQALHQSEYVVYVRGSFDPAYEEAAFASLAEAEAHAEALRDQHEFVEFGVMEREEFEAFAREDYEQYYGEPAHW